MDSESRTLNDLNEIIPFENEGYALINLYDNKSIKVAETYIDIEDIDKVKFLKWRISKKKNKIYVISGSPSKNSQLYLARYILNYTGEEEVDHIDGNELNNRKSNLRIVDHQKNIYNLSPKYNSKTQIRGVSYSQRDKVYKTDFSFGNYRFYFKSMKDINEAVYLRYLCEITFQKEFRYISNDDRILSSISKLTPLQKNEIEKYFEMKTGVKLNASNAS